MPGPSETEIRRIDGPEGFGGALTEELAAQERRLRDRTGRLRNTSDLVLILPACG